jgi:hypothetical protein
MGNLRPVSPPTIQEVDARLAKIEQELRRFEVLLQEKQDLAAYRYALVKITGAEMPPDPAQSPLPPKPQTLGVPYTLAYAEKILKAKGAEMHLDDMVKTARKQGWEGSGDDSKDRERFYSTMHRHPEKFKKTAPLTWSLKTS